MRCVSGLKWWAAALMLAGASLPCAAPPRAADSGPEALTVAARSALATLEARAAPAGVTLRLRRAADRAPLEVTDLAVSIEGRSAPATAIGDGDWSVPLARCVVAGDRLEVVVAHDGVREVLGGRFAAPGGTALSSPSPASRPAASAPTGAAGGAARFWRDHKQTAWWILNVLIVLIAAIAISRRMS
jgi:hypothetical protein